MGFGSAQTRESVLIKETLKYVCAKLLSGTANVESGRNNDELRSHVLNYLMHIAPESPFKSDKTEATNGRSAITTQNSFIMPRGIILEAQTSAFAMSPSYSGYSHITS